jgi:hypothetical protein
MLRSDLWVSAFVRRHNDLGHVCVVVRKGDPVAGQIFLELDHLNSTVSLYTPAPQALLGEDRDERLFQLRFDHVDAEKVRARIAQEQDFDPDLWVVSLEMRSGDLGIALV